jgi:L,D-transpeptidase ErfK/SrfK
MRTKLTKLFLLAFVLSGMLTPCPVNAGGYSYRRPTADIPALKWNTVVGWLGSHTVIKGDTLLDVARDSGLGFNEIQILYPNVDPWIPEPGMQVTLPVFWVLPSTKFEGIVINVPEMRLYRFIPEKNLVETYPVGIGTDEFETPVGNYRVVDRQRDPVWVVPPSLREKYSFAQMPAGPRNPLGAYWLGLSAKHIGIHGTNFPWAVGRQVSRGCIRLYPEHIERLYPEVVVGTPVEIIYEPVKVGFLNGDIYVEVHPDSEGRHSDLGKIALARIRELSNVNYVSSEKLKQALQDQTGVPVRIGSVMEGGDEGALRTAQKTTVLFTGSIN